MTRFLRRGHTFRVYDVGRVTIALDPEAHGGTYSPEVHLYVRRRTGIWNAAFRLPVIGFRRAFAWRRFGALRLYSAEARIVYRLFSTRRIGSGQEGHSR